MPGRDFDRLYLYVVNGLYSPLGGRKWAINVPVTSCQLLSTWIHSTISTIQRAAKVMIQTIFMQDTV